jgi:hypothetical protein
MAASKRKTRSLIEEAMQGVRLEALDAAEAAYPDAEWILVSFFDADAIIDLRDKDGEERRFRYRPEEGNDIAEERAMQGLRVRRITYEQPE